MDLTTTDQPPRLQRTIKNADGTLTHTLLTPERQEIICQTLQAGRGLSSAAAYANVSKRTIEEWRKRGAKALRGFEDGDELSIYELVLAEFEREVQLALAEFEGLHVSNIQHVALVERQWTASRYLLEKNHDDWKPAKKERERAGPTTVNFTLHFDSARDRALEPIDVQVIAQDDEEGTFLIPSGDDQDAD
jgi:hypothetical protein